MDGDGMITITESAQEYLVGLLAKQDAEVRGIRVFINDPGTPRAETCIAYCRDADIKGDDERRAFDKTQTADERECTQIAMPKNVLTGA